MDKDEAYGSFLMEQSDWWGNWVLFWWAGPCIFNPIFCWWVQLCSPPAIYLGPNYGGGNEDNGDLPQKIPCAFYPYTSKGRQNENHNHRKLTKLITWITGLSNSVKLWAMLCRATWDRRVMVESSDKTWPPGEGNSKPLQYSCLENPMNSQFSCSVMSDSLYRGRWSKPSPSRRNTKRQNGCLRRPYK